MSLGFAKPCEFGEPLMNIIGGRSSRYQLPPILTRSISSPRTSGFKLTHYASAAYQQTTYQAVSVPNGTYRASVWVRSGGGQTNLRLEASNHGGGTTLYSTDLKGTASPSTWTQLTLSNISVTTGTVTIGVHSNAAAGNWAAFDDVELTRQ